MPSIDLSSLSEKLQALAPQPPVPASRLFKILGPFLYHLAKQPASSNTVQTTHYLIQKWYVEQNKILDVDLSIHPSENYAGVCFSCGYMFSHHASVLSTTCCNCHSHESLGLYFFKDMLEYCYKIHPAQVDKLFCNLLDTKYWRSKCQK